MRSVKGRPRPDTPERGGLEMGKRAGVEFGLWDAVFFKARLTLGDVLQRLLVNAHVRVF